MYLQVGHFGVEWFNNKGTAVFKSVLCSVTSFSEILCPSKTYSSQLVTTKRDTDFFHVISIINSGHMCPRLVWCGLPPFQSSAGHGSHCISWDTDYIYNKSHPCMSSSLAVKMKLSSLHLPVEDCRKILALLLF